MGDGPKLVTVSSPLHHKALANGLWRFLIAQRGLDVDILIGEGRRSVRAHRLVVEVFLPPEKVAPGSLGSGEGGDNDNSSAVDKKADDVIARNLDSLLLEFLYNGEVTVRDDQLDALSEVARELDFGMLVEAIQSSRDDRRRSTRGERKRNVARVSKYKETSEEESDTDEEWESPPVKRAVRRTTRNCRAAPRVKESRSEKLDNDRLSVENPEEENACAVDGEAITEAAVDDSAPKTKLKSKSVGMAKVSPVKSKKAWTGVRRSVGRPRTSNDPPAWRKCKLCSYETFSEQRFQVHLAKHDPSVKVVKCATCEKKYAGDEALRLHQCTVKSKKCCPHCDYKTHDVVRYHVHLSKHDPNSAAPIFPCDVCRRPFLSREALDRHQRSQHAGGPTTFKCSHCSFETLKRITFHSHMFASHDLDMYGAPVLKKFRCAEPGCKYACARPSQLKKHGTEKHSTDKPYRCQLCPYASVRNSDVYNHNRNVHLGIRKYICETCGFRSTSNHGLDRHRRTHTGERPFVCEVCGKSYGDPATLKWHAQCHESAEKPFVCHICGHTSSRQQYLNAHLRGVHKIATRKPKVV